MLAAEEDEITVLYNTAIPPPISPHQFIKALASMNRCGRGLP